MWQPLDQCPMKVQIINLLGWISSRNMSCVFTRELNREPQQYSTDYLYKYPWSILVIYKSTCPGNYIPMVMPPLNPTSPPSMAATFLATRLMAVLQPSGYSVFHGRDTPIQLSLPWRSWSCQCLNTETSARGNRGCYTETPSISYTTTLYIRLVVTL